MIDLLTEAKDEARENGLSSLPKARVEHFHQAYRQIIPSLPGQPASARRDGKLNSYVECTIKAIFCEFRRKVLACSNSASDPRGVEPDSSFRRNSKTPN
ncbi:MAG: hypothetical protein ACLFRG_15280 [Desulfococcaceae bacterium]